MGPPRSVLEAYGVEGPVERLPGGQGLAWRVGPAVLKPLEVGPGAEEALRWQHGLLTRLDGRTDVRVAPPLLALDGRLAVDGWTAWRWEPGEHLAGRWREIIEVGERFAAAVRDEPEPPFLRTRIDRWAVADWMAWDELSPSAAVAADPVVAGLLDLRRPLDEPAQLVHGDLTSNVLFAPDLPPLVIDVSPYWRPVGYASAIVVADALVWEGAGPDLVDALPAGTGGQLLVRALLFRAVTDLLGAPGASTQPYRAAVDLARLLPHRTSR